MTFTSCVTIAIKYNIHNNIMDNFFNKMSVRPNYADCHGHMLCGTLYASYRVLLCPDEQFRMNFIMETCEAYQNPYRIALHGVASTADTRSTIISLLQQQIKHALNNAAT